ncbi:MAG: class I SAM-dependent methyltransferase [Planctomycetes bacterium]|nr:class I SAM-dependent methyltransferase [Planctomycetota bacterium]
MIPLTVQAHELIRTVIKPGDIAIDATAGNGHDTQFLAEAVGPTGMVFSFDIQESAISLTAQRLHAAGLTNVTLVRRSHAEMCEALPNVALCQITAIMFNLGYLPGGDKRLTTRSDSTLVAIQESLFLLAPGGIVTILTYPGHAGGENESQLVEEFLRGLPVHQVTWSEPSPSTNPIAPRLFCVRMNG